jgi:hypothetical protein
VTAPAACTSFWDFVVTSCPLSWYGINDLRHRRRGRDLAESRHTL